MKIKLKNMLEQKLQSKVIKYLKSNGYYCVKVITATVAGIPDILCCSPSGQFVAIELKKPDVKAEPSALQKYNLEQIQKRNGIAICANSLKTIKDIL